MGRAPDPGQGAARWGWGGQWGARRGGRVERSESSDLPAGRGYPGSAQDMTNFPSRSGRGTTCPVRRVALTPMESPAK